MSASVIRCDDHVICLEGIITAENVTSIRSDGERLIRDRSGTMRVDLSRLQNAQSVVLSLLLAWKRCARQFGVELLVCDMPVTLREMAVVSGLVFLLAENECCD